MNYDACNIDTTDGAMRKETGIFTAKEAGIYEFHFVGYFKTSTYCEIVKGNETIQFFGRWNKEAFKDQIESSISGSVITKLNPQEEISVKTHDNYGSRKPYIWSEEGLAAIHFSGKRLA